MALEKARAEEAAAKQREADRQRKAQEQQAAKLEKQQRQKEAKEAAKRQKLEQKQLQRAQPVGGAEAVPEAGQQKVKARRERRGAGTREIGEDDHEVLRSRFDGRSVAVVQDAKSFAATIALGVPVIWRCTRSCVSKVLSNAGISQKHSQSLVAALNADRTAMAGELASMAENTPDRIKNTRPVPDALQETEVAEAWALNTLMEEHLQENAPALPCAVVDGGRLEELVRDVADEQGTPEAKLREVVEKLPQVQLVGFIRGKDFSAVLPGGLAHVRYQLEGSCSIALASANEARENTITRNEL